MDGTILILFWIVFGALTGWVGSLVTDRKTARSTVLFISISTAVSCLVGLLLYTSKSPLAEINAISYLVIPTIAAATALFLINRVDNDNN